MQKPTPMQNTRMPTMQMETQLQRIHRQSTQTPQMLQNMRNTIHRLQHGLRPMPQKVPGQTHKRSRRRTRTQNMRRMRRQNKPIHHRMQNMHETPMEPSSLMSHAMGTAIMRAISMPIITTMITSKQACRFLAILLFMCSCFFLDHHGEFCDLGCGEEQMFL